MDDEAFYRPLSGGSFRPTVCAQGPTHQYGGAVAALLLKSAEDSVTTHGFQLAKATCDFLGPIPISDVTLEAHTARQGASLQLVVAELFVAGTKCATLRAWWMRSTHLDVPRQDEERLVPTIPPAQPHPRPPFGYLRASERRFVHGDFLEPGPAFVWSRTQLPLIEGTPATRLQHLFINTDIACGVSSVLDWNDFVFANVDLTIHLHRQPTGEWTGMDAVTRVNDHGTGTTHAQLWDEKGPIGTAAQALYVAHR
ncbi:thioesterase family protein [Streptomyces sp. SPB162]|uniref:thioesterase family protein n=1 Tax=Streptomyces sp. SPB162 TaxID=2940560 RepID=UPI0024058613|nr:thioesterase family protein [Streptomyces sp. SPB162]MDF9817166.1 acyl-CoA thioesterase [Streptomyces sp. SPB162]